MKHGLKRGLLFWIILATLFFFSSVAVAGTAVIDRKLYSDLLKFKTDKKIVQVDGVPCMKIFLPPGQSLSYFCRFRAILRPQL